MKEMVIETMFSRCNPKLYFIIIEVLLIIFWFSDQAECQIRQNRVFSKVLKNSKQAYSGLSSRDRILYSVFTHEINEYCGKLSHAKKYPKGRYSQDYLEPSHFIFLEDYGHKLSFRFLQKFKNFQIPIKSSKFMVIDKTFKDKVTGDWGFRILVSDIVKVAKTKTKVFYSVTSSMHSGAGFCGYLSKKDGIWVVSKVENKVLY